MSGKLIDDYLSELMDDPAAGKPGTAETAPAPAAESAAPAAPAIDAAVSNDNGSASIAPDSISSAPVSSEPISSEPVSSEPVSSEPVSSEPPPSAPVSPAAAEPEVDAAAPELPAAAAPAATVAQESAPPADPLAAFREGPKTIGDDEFERMLDTMQGRPALVVAELEAAEPAADPLASFREGPKNISDDEFERMLDTLQGKPPPAAPEPTGDPLAAFRDGGKNIDDSEFEAMLDVLQGKTPPPPAPATAIAVAKPAAAPPPRATPAVHAEAPAAKLEHAVSAIKLPESALRAIEALVGRKSDRPIHPDLSGHPEKRRRADDTISSWLRFNVGRQCFAVEVLKVQEVLRVPFILPVRGTDRAMLGVMNLRGQIVPVMDLGLRLGFEAVEANEASRVIVLEEHGETLGMLVASVADVSNLSDARIERLGSAAPSLVAADVVRGIARRDGVIVILLDGTRLLA